MDVLRIYEIVFAVFAFVLGATVGSFLNVVIYRLPRGMSVNEPRRSFCPGCEKQIPWHRNLPIVSWLLLRGRCADCGVRISPRYLLVEALTGALFLAVWLRFPFPESAALWIFLGLLIAATFIDFEHFIIPDEITIGGTIAGVVCATLLPGLLDARVWWHGLLQSVVGAAVGFALLFAVVKLGKMAFGRKRVQFDKPEPFRWRREQDRGYLEMDGAEHAWEEFFPDEKAVLVLECASIELPGQTLDRPVTVRSSYESLEADGVRHDLNTVESFRGTAVSVFFERDAMGFGDVKFIACIGAFLGWQGAVFSVVSASLVGSVVGVAALALGRREWSAKLPFGPYLTLGALLWMAAGPAVVGWYIDLLRGA
jgi:leader peptidase (prepilin peptidase)/N-methyltransferase